MIFCLFSADKEASEEPVPYSGTEGNSGEPSPSSEPEQGILKVLCVLSLSSLRSRFTQRVNCGGVHVVTLFGLHNQERCEKKLHEFGLKFDVRL